MDDRKRQPRHTVPVTEEIMALRREVIRLQARVAGPGTRASRMAVDQLAYERGLRVLWAELAAIAGETLAAQEAAG